MNNIIKYKVYTPHLSTYRNLLQYEEFIIEKVLTPDHYTCYSIENLFLTELEAQNKIINDINEIEKILKYKLKVLRELRLKFK